MIIYNKIFFVAEDDLFKDTDYLPENGEHMPEFFSKVDPSSEMNLFSPKKPKDTVSISEIVYFPNFIRCPSATKRFFFINNEL